MKIYVLVKTYTYSDDGFDIIEVFSSIELLRKYVLKVYPKFKIDEDGNYYYYDDKNKFSEKEYLEVLIFDLITKFK